MGARERSAHESSSPQRNRPVIRSTATVERNLILISESRCPQYRPESIFCASGARTHPLRRGLSRLLSITRPEFPDPPSEAMKSLLRGTFDVPNTRMCLVGIHEQC